MIDSDLQPLPDPPSESPIKTSQVFSAKLSQIAPLDPAIGKMFAEIGSVMFSASERINAKLSEISLAVQSTASQFIRQLELALPALERFAENVDQWPETNRQALMRLARAGWFIDREMPFNAPQKLAARLTAGKRRETDEALMTYFDGRVDEIEDSLREAFPARAKVLASAFSAHKDEQFDLSVPVFLAQTDGICMDVVEAYLFTGPEQTKSDEVKKAFKGRPGTAEYVHEMAADAAWAALLNPFGRKLPINFSKSERGPKFRGLNRHMVLHGESHDYGTRINSLKAMSLLNYAGWVLRESKVAAS